VGKRGRWLAAAAGVLGGLALLLGVVILGVRFAPPGGGLAGGLQRHVGCGTGVIEPGDPGAEAAGQPLGAAGDPSAAPDGALPEGALAASSDAAPDPPGAVSVVDQSLCYGDVPCGPVAVRAPSPGCQAANANAHPVTTVGASAAGFPETALAAPAVGVRVADPDFGTCLTRATPPGWMNGYARFTAFNADSSRLLVRKAGGDWFVLDADALGAPTRALGVSGDEAAARWHGRDPDVLFYLKRNQLFQYQVSTGAETLAFDPGRAPGLAGCGAVTLMSLGGSEGDSSAASRYWGFHAQTATACGGNTNHLVTVDRGTGTSWVHHLPAGRGFPDNSSMSATGKYFNANYQGTPCASGVPGTIDAPCGVMAYSITLDAAFMAHPGAGHHDDALSREGHDVVVVKSNTTDFIEAVDLETRATTRIASLNLADGQAWDFHVSGSNWATPGWVLLSQDSFSWNTHYLSRQIVAVELADFSVARVVHLAHHRTQSTDYWTQEPHAAVNADFTRVAWHSNWYGGTTEADNSLFFLELPPGLLNTL